MSYDMTITATQSGSNHRNWGGGTSIDWYEIIICVSLISWDKTKFYIDGSFHEKLSGLRLFVSLRLLCW